MTIRWALLDGMPPDCAEVPVWLGPAERRTLANLHLPKRRADWLLGRCAAKSVVAPLLAEASRIELPPDAFDIVSDPSGAPVVRLADGETVPVGVSISHSDGMAFSAAWADADDGLSAGADLERIAPRSTAFVRDFFRPEEIDAWNALSRGRARDVFATAVWSAKEAVLKALRLGLTVDTRAVGILLLESQAGGLPALPRPDGGAWKGFAVCSAPALRCGGQPFAGFWRECGGFVLSIAVTTTQKARSRAA